MAATPNIKCLTIVKQVFFSLSPEGSLVGIWAYQPYTLVGPPVNGLVLEPPNCFYLDNHLYIFFADTFPFEMIVLDSALNVTVNKFQHYLSWMKPVCNSLLDLAAAAPCEKTLKKIIAFKKSLFLFEQKYFFFAYSSIFAMRGLPTYIMNKKYLFKI